MGKWSAHVLNWTAAFSAPNGVPERWTNVFGDPDAGPEVMGYVLKLPADAPDCDNDGTPDVVEIVVFGSPDDNGNGIPDSCPTLPGDFNNDGKVDGHEVPHHNEPPHVGNPKA